MVATIDGKTVSGARGEPVQDLGSSNDHQLMRKIENAAQAVLIGAASQRSSKAISYPAHLLRIVATRSGNLDYDSRFFRDAGGSRIAGSFEAAGGRRERRERAVDSSKLRG